MTRMRGAAPPLRRIVPPTAGPSLACDLSLGACRWRSRPSCAENELARPIFDGREELAERVRDFWSDAARGHLLHRDADAGPPRRLPSETDPERLWAAIEAAVATMPARPGPGVRDPRGPRSVFLDRIGHTQGVARLAASLHWTCSARSGSPSTNCGRPPSRCLIESGAQAVTPARARARPSPRSSTVVLRLYLRGCCRHHRTARRSGSSLLVVPCLFFGRSLYLEFPGLTLIGAGMRRARRHGLGPVPSRWRGGSRRWPTPPGWPCCISWPPGPARSATWPPHSGWPSRRSACTSSCSAKPAWSRPSGSRAPAAAGRRRRRGHALARPPRRGGAPDTQGPARPATT